MASFAARISFVLLALAVFLPALALAPAASALEASPVAVSQPAETQHPHSIPGITVASESGQRHCPDQAPATPHCHAPADHSLALARIAPRPDTADLFGSVPHASGNTRTPTGIATANWPDLHELSILRV